MTDYRLWDVDFGSFTKDHFDRPYMGHGERLLLFLDRTNNYGPRQALMLKSIKEEWKRQNGLFEPDQMGKRVAMETII